MEKARQRPEIPVAATDQDNADLAERTPGSLVGMSLTQLLLEKRDLRTVAIDGLDATKANLRQRDYPYTKLLYFVTRDAARRGRGCVPSAFWTRRQPTTSWRERSCFPLVPHESDANP